MADESGNMGKGSPTLAARVIDEIRRFVVMFLYLWVLFGLFVLHEHIILRQRHIDVVWNGLALINALVLAKVMLVAEDLDIGRRLRRRPLLFPILFDAFFLAILFIVFHFVEDATVAHFRGAGKETHDAIGGGRVAGLLSVATILFVSLLPFFAFRHISRELGPDRLKAMLLGTDEGAA